MTTRGGLGPQGFRGPTGEKGPKGPTGPTGNNGVGDPYWQLNSISNNLSPINNYSINKSIIDGLAKVENTSDLNKQISTSCQDALNSKINNTDIDNQISGAINNLVLDAESNLNTLKKITQFDKQISSELLSTLERQSSGKIKDHVIKTAVKKAEGEIIDYTGLPTRKKVQKAIARKVLTSTTDLV